MQTEWLASAFEEKRTHLRGVAYRMLGSSEEAEDAVQEAWLRVSHSGADGVDNLGGWLTTIVSRICLDMLRSRKSRREEELVPRAAEIIAGDAPDPEREAVIADAIGPALLVVLNTLSPSERIAFVLHDLFAMPFDEIAPIVGRSAVAARQLASRARRRVQGGTFSLESDRSQQKEIVNAFLAASRNGEFERLLVLLDPNATLRVDPAIVAMGGADNCEGAHAVAQSFAGRAQGAQLALLDGEAGAVWAPGGAVRVAFAFVVDQGKIVEIELIAGAERIEALAVAMLQ